MFVYAENISGIYKKLVITVSFWGENRGAKSGRKETDFSLNLFLLLNFVTCKCYIYSKTK